MAGPRAQRQPHTRLSHSLVAALSLSLPLALCLLVCPVSAQTPNPAYNSLATDTGYAGGCNLYEGYWVRDFNRPAYTENCPFVPTLFKCQAHGRKDTLFRDWSWYSPQCKRTLHFGPYGFLRLMRNKTLGIVGDSILIDNFLPSLLCQISKVARVNPPTFKYTNGGRLSQFERKMIMATYVVPAYGFRILSMWDDRLMRNSFNKQMLAAIGQYTPGPQDVLLDLQTPNPQWTSSLDLMDVVLMETTTHWRAIVDAPRMIFTNSMWQPIQGLDPYTAHAKAMRSIRMLFEKRRLRGKLFPIPYFMTAPPQHSAAKIGGNGICGSPGRLLNVAEIGKMGRLNVQVARFLPIQRSVFPDGCVVRRLDITIMSAYRPEAHVGNYTGRGGKGVDCLHWCNPGVPEAWTDMFYQSLIRERLLTNPASVLKPPAKAPVVHHAPPWVRRNPPVVIRRSPPTLVRRTPPFVRRAPPIVKRNPPWVHRPPVAVVPKRSPPAPRRIVPSPFFGRRSPPATHVMRHSPPGVNVAKGVRGGAAGTITSTTLTPPPPAPSPSSFHRMVSALSLTLGQLNASAPAPAAFPPAAAPST